MERDCMIIERPAPGSCPQLPKGYRMRTRPHSGFSPSRDCSLGPQPWTVTGLLIIRDRSRLASIRFHLSGAACGIALAIALERASHAVCGFGSFASRYGSGSVLTHVSCRRYRHPL